jgi:hypothetical protein
LLMRMDAVFLNIKMESISTHMESINLNPFMDAKDRKRIIHECQAEIRDLIRKYNDMETD